MASISAGAIRSGKKVRLFHQESEHHVGVREASGMPNVDFLAKGSLIEGELTALR